MADVLRFFNLALQEFSARVHKVAAEQWSAPTPASEWSVADLVEHLIEENRWVAPLLSGHSLDAAAKLVEAEKRSADDDRPALWDAVARSSSHAVNGPDALERQVDLSRGSTPARDYVNEMTMDLTVHAWDLGTAIGVEDPLPEDLVQFVLGMVESYGDLSGSGVFAAPQPVPEGATAEQRLVALTGRRPV